MPSLVCPSCQSRILIERRPRTRVFHLNTSARGLVDDYWEPASRTDRRGLSHSLRRDGRRDASNSAGSPERCAEFGVEQDVARSKRESSGFAIIERYAPGMLLRGSEEKNLSLFRNRLGSRGGRCHTVRFAGYRRGISSGHRRRGRRLEPHRSTLHQRTTNHAE